MNVLHALVVVIDVAGQAHPMFRDHAYARCGIAVGDFVPVRPIQAFFDDTEDARDKKEDAEADAEAGFQMGEVKKEEQEVVAGSSASKRPRLAPV